jgi:starvation-inducible DNA-binding protein
MEPHMIAGGYRADRQDSFHSRVRGGYGDHVPRRDSIDASARCGRVLSTWTRRTHMTMNIGIAREDRETVAEHLSRLLADTYSLYLKTHSFHWNVTGPQFNSLHAMFETQYNELWVAADEVAERIRTLDVFAPGSYSQFGRLTSIKEEPGVPEWKDMVAQLVEGHEFAAATARATIKAADSAGDEGTADLVTGRLKEHEKTAWMLRSLLR